MSNYIDKVVYINLDKRTDRKEEIEKELNNMGLSYERFPAIYHSGPYVGCGYSHLQVVKNAKERGLKNVMIIEDDFTFLVSKEELEDCLTELFEKKPDFDVCMGEYSFPKLEDIHLGRIKKMNEASNASFYIVNSHYFDSFINLYETNLPLLESTGMHSIYANDQIWKQLQRKDNWVCFNPRVGKQRNIYSDNLQAYQYFD